MADNNLITGYWGEPHVTAENERGINAGIIGAGRFVLPVGERFKAEYIGNNMVRLYDGKLIDNGAAAGIPAGEFWDFTIYNANQGMYRNDLIVFKYSQDASTLIEKGEFIIFSGKESSGTPSDPELTQSDLLSGKAKLDYMPLWRIQVYGATIAPPEQMFTMLDGTSKMMEDIADLTDDLDVARGEIRHLSGLTINGKPLTSDIELSYGDVGAAPGGFGLGASYGKMITDCNAATSIGFYSLGGLDSKNHPSKMPSGGYGTMLVERRHDRIYQTAKYGAYVAQRYGDIGSDGTATFQPWEYVNPPMNEGVEYRTTERFNGNAVYTKLIKGTKKVEKASFSSTISATGYARLIRQSSEILADAMDDGGVQHIFTYSPNIENLKIDDDSKTLTGTYTLPQDECAQSVNTAYLQVWYVVDE